MDRSCKKEEYSSGKRESDLNLNNAIADSYAPSVRRYCFGPGGVNFVRRWPTPTNDDKACRAISRFSRSYE